ncbi:hypothetical protein IKP85_03390 [bacterium]|nr:hypothetical protein [bacterium]
MQIYTNGNNNSTYFTARYRALMEPLIIPKNILQIQLGKGLSFEDICKLYNNRISVAEVIAQAKSYGIPVNTCEQTANNEAELLSQIMGKLNLKSDDIAGYFK